jgi:hypothetical protein
VDPLSDGLAAWFSFDEAPLIAALFFPNTFENPNPMDLSDYLGLEVSFTVHVS